MKSHIILGAGVTGLAAGYVSGLPVYEAIENPGGICASYYIKPFSSEKLYQAPYDSNAYHFEIGGGHWIFGGDPVVSNFIHRMAPVKIYKRLSSVYFPDSKTYVPYPLQNNLRFLGNAQIKKILGELESPQRPFSTMEEWLGASFGQTLTNLFFSPFHNLYTAGLYRSIAPQDAYKSPVNLQDVKRGALEQITPAGYNVSFVYPEGGLDVLAKQMAEKCDIRYGKGVVKIDVKNREVFFEDKTHISYDKMISTLPLNKMVEICDLKTKNKPDPYTSVLVLNIGAVKGDLCPPDHWIYVPSSKSGFHRVGFYSNVDDFFVPKDFRAAHNRVSIYVERSFANGQKPDKAIIKKYEQEVIQELQEWGYIKEIEVVDPTWINVAYTWGYPNSQWKQEAMRLLESYQIYPVGRYARWNFQGIADSIRDGFFAGGSLK